MKKTKLLIATAALSLAAVAAGTVSTMAWFQVGGATLKASTETPSYGLSITADSASNGEITVKPTLSVTSGVIRPTDDNGDVYYWSNGSLIKDLAHSVSGTGAGNTTGEGNYLAVTVGAEISTDKALNPGETVLTLLAGSENDIKIQLAAVDYTSNELQALTGKTQGNKSYVNITLVSTDKYKSSNANSVQTGNLSKTSTDWTIKTGSDNKVANLNTGYTFYVSLKGGTSADKNEGQEVGVTLKTDVFKLVASAVL